MAISCGRAHFKCPLCSDKTKFFNEAINFGVYVPEKDADWEDPELEDFYNFQGMGKKTDTEKNNNAAIPIVVVVQDDWIEDVVRSLATASRAGSLTESGPSSRSRDAPIAARRLCTSSAADS